MNDGMNRLVSVLDRLTDVPDPKTDAENKEKCAVEFKEIYANGFRHSYSVLSSYLECLDGEQRDWLVVSIDEILTQITQRVDWSDSERDKVHESVFKLQDHIYLECIRLNRMDQIKYYDKQIESNLSLTKSEVENSQVQTRKILRQVNSVNSQVISILGIFAGLVFGFSSGFQLMSESFSSLANVKLNIVLIYILCIGLVLFNLCFLLMYCASKMSNQSIAVKCKSIDCSMCKEKCGFIKRSWRKYPYPLCFNLLDAFLLIVLLLLTICKIM